MANNVHPYYNTHFPHHFNTAKVCVAYLISFYVSVVVSPPPLPSGLLAKLNAPPLHLRMMRRPTISSCSTAWQSCYKYNNILFRKVLVFFSLLQNRLKTVLRKWTYYLYFPCLVVFLATTGCYVGCTSFSVVSSLQGYKRTL